MPEYSGYQNRKTVDWASIGKEISTTVDQGLKAREERKAADQKLLTDSEKKLSAWEGTQNKSYDQVILGGLEDARNKKLQWNKDLRSGALSRNEYQMRIQNLDTSFDSLVMTTKNFDNYVIAVNQAYKDGEMGAEGMAKAKIQIDAMQMGNKTLNVGDNGDMFMVSDLSGNVPVQNVKNWSKMANITSPKLDVSTTVDETVGKWEPIITSTVGPNGETLSIENVRENPAYKTAKESLIGSIVNEDDPSSVVSVLLDNSNLDYQPYFSGDDVTSLVQKAAKIKEAVDNKPMTQEEALAFSKDYKENHLIEIVLNNNGELVSNVTPKMIADARGVVANKIEARLGWKEEKEAAQIDRGGGGGGGSSKVDDRAAAADQERVNEYQRGYVASLNAFAKDDKGNVIKGKAPDFSGLDNSYQYRNYKGKVYVYKMGSFDESGKKTKKAVLVNTILDPKGLAQYTVYGKSAAEKTTNYERGRAQYREAKGLSGNTSGNKPAATTIKASDIPAKAKAAGYSTEEYRKLLQNKGIKII